MLEILFRAKTIHGEWIKVDAITKVNDKYIAILEAFDLTTDTAEFAIVEVVAETISLIVGNIHDNPELLLEANYGTG